MGRRPDEGVSMKAYPAGWPLWQAVGRHGFPISVRVEVFHDEEAGVYVAVNSNLPGLVAEGESWDELIKNVDAGAKDLLSSYLHSDPIAPAMQLRLCPV